MSALKSHLQLLRELPCLSFPTFPPANLHIPSPPNSSFYNPIQYAASSHGVPRAVLLTRDVVRWQNPFCINNKINSVITRPMENLVVSSWYCKHNCKWTSWTVFTSLTQDARGFVPVSERNWPFVPIIPVLIRLATISVDFLRRVCSVYQITSDATHLFLYLTGCCATLFQDCIRLQRDQLDGGDESPFSCS